MMDWHTAALCAGSFVAGAVISPIAIIIVFAWLGSRAVSRGR